MSKSALDPLITSNFVQHRPNEHGVMMTEFVCMSCWQTFTVTPAVDQEHAAAWSGCLADTCPSYRIDRDPVALQWIGEAGPFLEEKR